MGKDEALALGDLPDGLAGRGLDLPSIQGEANALGHPRWFPIRQSSSWK
jgi:hypothetical protein